MDTTALFPRTGRTNERSVQRTIFLLRRWTRVRDFAHTTTLRVLLAHDTEVKSNAPEQHNDNANIV
jgi:hypothetical protein